MSTVGFPSTEVELSTTVRPIDRLNREEEEADRLDRLNREEADRLDRLDETDRLLGIRELRNRRFIPKPYLFCLLASKAFLQKDNFQFLNT